MSTTPEQNQKAYDDSFDEQFAEMLATSKAALANYERTLSDVEKSMIGNWRGKPAKLENWVFFRCGEKRSAVAQSLAHMLRQQGWTDAPRGVTMIGTELWDGTEGALVICAPLEVYRRMKAIEQIANDKAAMREQAGKMNGLGGALDGMSGVQVDVLEVKTGEDSLEAVRALQEEARAKRPPKRS